MVTRSVIRITPAERASAAEDSNRDDDNQLRNKERDDGDYDKYDTKKGGEEIQLCSFKGYLSESRAAADGRFCDGHSHHDVSSHCKPNDDTIYEGKTTVRTRRHNANTPKKRPLFLEDTDDGNGERKQNFIDLIDVPPQSPIKSKRRDGASKYKGICFAEENKKWQARIMIDAEQHVIGYYDNEEAAAVDYARAMSKYNAGSAGGERKRKKFIDLTDVPSQPPILKKSNKSNRASKTSKYKGVTPHKATDKWAAQIWIDGKQHNIGYYDDEEEAAVDYARAVFKYDLGSVEGVRKKQQKFIDLNDVLPQSPILRDGSIKDGASKYQGVCFDKAKKKWKAQISVDGETHYIGCYDEEEEAAVDYARAKFKYKTEKNPKEDHLRYVAV